MSGGLTTEYDPVARKSFLRYVDFYRLASESGEPVPQAAQQPSAGLTPGRFRELLLPQGLPERCRREADRLQSAIRRMWALIERSPLLDGNQKFTTSVANPDLEREVRLALTRTEGLPAHASSLQVSCRGTRCAFPGAETGDLDEAWLKRLVRSNSDLLARSEYDSRNWPRQHFLLAWSPEELARPSVTSIACLFANEAKEAGVLPACEREHRPRGNLQLVLALPDPHVSEPGRRLGVDSRGDLAATLFSRCLLDGLREVARAFEVPLLREGGRQVYRITVPGSTSILGDESTACDQAQRP